METKLAIYCNDNNCDLIYKIIDFFKQKNRIVCGHVFTDSDNTCSSDIACLPSFYMPFYKGIIVFTNIHDFIDNQSELISEKIYVMISSISDIKDNHVDKKIIDNTKFLTLDSEAIHELQ